MRKRWIGTFIVLLLIVFLNVSPAHAYSESDFASLPYVDAAKYSTVITDVDGALWAHPGILNAETLQVHPEVAYIRSYEILCGGQSVLSVDLHDIVPLRSTEGGSGSISAGSNVRTLTKRESFSLHQRR